MTVERIIKKAVRAAKKTITSGLDEAAQLAGMENSFGDKTLVLDLRAEDVILNTLAESGIPFAVMSEEKGHVRPREEPEYLAIVDPIDGSTNLERGVPLCTIGIAVAPYSGSLSTDDIELSVIASVFTADTYVAVAGKGARRNGKTIRVAPPRPIDQSIVSYDTKRRWDKSFAESSARVLSAVRDMRRSASNLIDLCWTAQGSLDAMVDLRSILPIVHVSGTHIVKEAGGIVLDSSGRDLRLLLEMNQRMSFVAASNRDLAQEIIKLYDPGRG